MLNPHPTGSPKWLLHTNIESKELEAQVFARDSERYAAKAEASRAMAAEFRAALKALEGAGK